MSNTSYSVEAKTTDEVFGTGSISYKVPVFQRAYSWGTEEVDALLEDLFGDNTATGITPDDATQYFLGSIVVARSEQRSRLLILDGQQRLTTLSLILAVLAAKLSQLGAEDVGDIRKHLRVGKAGEVKEPILRMQDDDHSLYSSLLNDALQEIPRSSRRTKLARAVDRIKLDIDERTVGLTDEGLIELLWHMARKVLYGVTLVRIEAPSESAAFALFETLNDRGLELSAADLIKNKVLSRAGQDVFDHVVALWEDIVELVSDNEIVNFLRYYWIAKYDAVRKSNLYDAYARRVNSMNSHQVVTFLKDIRKCAIYYKHVVQPDRNALDWPESWNQETYEALLRVRDFRAKSCRPLFLAVGDNATDIEFAVKVAESVTVRHSVIANGNANILERAYADTCRMIRENTAPIEAIRSNMAKVMPPDSEFIPNISKNRMGTSDNASWRRILVELNNYMSTGEHTLRGSDSVQIEHILPKSLSDDQLLHHGLTKQEHEEYVGALGNLTLIHSTKNARASNRPLNLKMTEYESSEVNLTREIVQYVTSNRIELWGKNEIITRTEGLAKRMAKIWPTYMA